MRTLVIDTATAACSVALIEDGAVIDARHEVVGRGHAERLLPMIADLADGGRADALLVDCGPGSFTGVRVGLAAAIGLGIGWGVAVRGYSSLPLIAAGALAQVGGERLAVVIEGGHGEVFMQAFDSPLTACGPLASLRPEAALAARDGRQVVGSGLHYLRAIDPDVPGVEALPRAADAIRLPAAFASLPARPIYGRAPDAKPKAA